MTTLVGSVLQSGCLALFMSTYRSIISPVFACLISSSLWHLASLSEEGKAKPSKFYEFRFEMCFLYMYVEMVVLGRLNEDKHFKGI